MALPKDRFVAAAIDFVPPFLLFILFAVVGDSGVATIVAMFGSIYLVFRDVVGNGQSLGKRFRDLQVIDTDTDRVPDTMGLVMRNLGFGVPGLNVIYAVVEGIQLLRHPQHLRFGDIFVDTGVVKVSKEERERLLKPPVERRSRDSIKPIDAAAPAPDMSVEEGEAPAPAPQPAQPAAKRGVPIDLPPDPSAAGSSSAPKRAPVPLDAPAPSSSAPKRPSAPVPRPTPPPPPTKAALEQAAANAAKFAPPPPKPTAAPGGAAPLPEIPKGGPEEPGVDIDDDDPLKKLIEKAGAKS